MQFLTTTTTKKLYRRRRTQPGSRLPSPSLPVDLFHFANMLLEHPKSVSVHVSRRPITEHISTLLSSLLLGPQSLSFIDFAITNPDSIAKIVQCTDLSILPYTISRNYDIDTEMNAQRNQFTPIHQFLAQQINYEQ